MVLQQPMFTPRIVDADPPTTPVYIFDDEEMMEPLPMKEEWKRVYTVETAPEADGNTETRLQENDDVSIKENDLAGNTLRETIKRLHDHGMPLREIAPLVGMAGRKYEQLKRLCEEEGL